MSTKFVTIGEARADDAAQLADFAARSFRAAFAAENSEKHMREHIECTFSPELQAREIADTKVSSLLAFESEQLLAYAQVRRSSPPACVKVSSPIELHRFYVDKAAHGLGVAQQLMDSVVKDAQKRLAEHLWLGVWERNPRAIRFYEKCGFADVGSQTFCLGSDPQTDRVLLKKLNA
ncbi:MAG: GNAT family N-acetyltransferase [Pseudomonadota bacterium]